MLQFQRKIGLYSLGGREGRRKQALYFDRIQSRLLKNKMNNFAIFCKTVFSKDTANQICMQI